MHGVATQAGHCTALVAWRLEQSVVLAAGHADVSVGPKEVIEDVRVLLEHRLEPRLFVELCRLDNRCCFCEIITRAVAETVRGPVFAFVEPFHSVARPANLCATCVVEIGRLHDSQRF